MSRSQEIVKEALDGARASIQKKATLAQVYEPYEASGNFAKDKLSESAKDNWFNCGLIYISLLTLGFIKDTDPMQQVIDMIERGLLRSGPPAPIRGSMAFRSDLCDVSMPIPKELMTWWKNKVSKFELVHRKDALTERAPAVLARGLEIIGVEYRRGQNPLDDVVVKAALNAYLDEMEKIGKEFPYFFISKAKTNKVVDAFFQLRTDTDMNTWLASKLPKRNKRP